MKASDSKNSKTKATKSQFDVINILVPKLTTEFWLKIVLLM